MGETLRGVFPVLSTPFDDGGGVDAAALARLAEYALAAGAHGVVYPGIASEFATLADGERRALVEVVLDRVASRRPVIVGVSAATAGAAAALAAHARRRGAAALMVMPPPTVGAQVDALLRFLEPVAGDGATPLMLQNAPPPLGSSLPVATVIEVVRRLPAFGYVKEETVPCGQRISALLAAAPAGFLGAFGGAGGRFVLDELARGALGSMPACEAVEIHVAIYEAMRRGDRRAARDLHNRVLPLLNLGSVFRTPVTKAALRRRGLLASARHRDHNPALDPHDLAELDSVLDDLADLMPRMARAS